MGHFHDDYEHASADLVDYYGRPILYSDPTLSEPAGVTAKVYGENGERRQNDYGWYWVQTRAIEIMHCEVEVRSDGIFTIDDQDYSIESIGVRGEAKTKIELTRSQAGEITRPGYRGRQ